MKQEAGSSLKAVFLGMAGGLTAAAIMGAFAILVPLPGSGGVPFFVLATEQMGLGSSSFFAGWILHFGTGAAIGAIFGLTFNTFRRLRSSTVGHSVRMGIVAGVVVGRFLREEGLPMCEICGATFTSRQLLKDHSQAVHLGKRVQGISAP